MGSAPRFILSGLAALSLLLCAITTGLWIRSYRSADFWQVWQSQSTHLPPAIAGSSYYSTKLAPEFPLSYRYFFLLTLQPGHVSFERREMHDTDPFHNEPVFPFDRPLALARHFPVKHRRWAFFGASYFVLAPSLTPSTSTIGPRVIVGDGFNVLTVPLGFLAVASALPLVWFLRRTLKKWRFHRRGMAGRCLACGYDLRATSERCPECGVPMKPWAPRSRMRRAGGWLGAAAGFAFLTVAGKGANWIGFSAWPLYRYLHAQYQCEHYAPEADEVVFECAPDLPTTAPVGMATFPAVIGFDAARHAPLRATYAMRAAPDCWREWRDHCTDDGIAPCCNTATKPYLQIYSGAPLFLGVRQAHGSDQFIVVVMQPVVGTDTVRDWHIDYCTVYPGDRFHLPRLQKMGSEVLLVKPWRHIRFFPGQADPDDASRLTLPYDVDGVRGALSCQLRETSATSVWANDPLDNQLTPGSPGRLARH